MIKRGALSIFFVSLFLLAPLAQAKDFLDRDSTIFFPPSLKTQIQASQDFPVFWWNFLILNQVNENDEARWSLVQKTCHALKALPPELISQVECEPQLSEFAGPLQDWAHDLPLRENLPSSETTLTHFNQTLAQASFTSGNPSLLDLLRQDPFQTWKDLKTLAEKRNPIPFAHVRGYFYDHATARVIIPIQFAFGPQTARQTQVVLDSIGTAGSNEWMLIGPHGSTAQNQNRIIEDLRGVSLIGFVVLVLFGICLTFMGAIRLVPLFGVVFLGTGIGFFLTYLVFGGVHGLTVSFGSAIIGLAMDYAFQAALNSKEPGIWRSNFCGLSTTLIGLFVLMFSSVPLLRQMMFFSATGLASSFVLCYFLFKFYGSRFEVKVFAYSPRPKFFVSALTTSLLAFALYGMVTLHPLLDLRQFDYSPKQNREVSLWLYQTLGMRAPLFDIHPTATALTDATAERDWANENKIGVENISQYLPPVDSQKQHLESWSSWPRSSSGITPNMNQFFQPYFEGVSHQPVVLAEPVRNYLRHLYRNQKWISLWLPKTAEEETRIHAHFPQVTSMGDIVSSFPLILARELGWMGPLSILLATLFHFVYYRRWSYSVIALLPFFTGVGLISLAKILLHFELSFISIMGVILVFGFSLDYGIFATDACLYPERKGMWPGIVLAAVSTIAGFVPLVFCQHPVLRDLGTTLFFGGLGTFLGALYTIPWVMRRMASRA